jgi:hypothetical protein
VCAGVRGRWPLCGPPRYLAPAAAADRGLRRRVRGGVPRPPPPRRVPATAAPGSPRSLAALRPAAVSGAGRRGGPRSTAAGPRGRPSTAASLSRARDRRSRESAIRSAPGLVRGGRQPAHRQAGHGRPSGCVDGQAHTGEPASQPRTEAPVMLTHRYVGESRQDRSPLDRPDRVPDAWGQEAQPRSRSTGPQNGSLNHGCRGSHG